MTNGMEASNGIGAMVSIAVVHTHKTMLQSQRSSINIKTILEGTVDMFHFRKEAIKVISR